VSLLAVPHPDCCEFNQAIGSEPRLSELYDESFYENQVAQSVRSARIYLKFLWRFFQPASVLDVGCGRGAWLKACHELGSKRLLGLDGDWNKKSLMIDSVIDFQSIDLNKPFSVPEKVELAMSLEVAEHLEPSAAPQFVKSLAKSSDMVLFSAAYTKQGGTNHINEQPHSYWAQLFAGHGFVPFDLFRPVFWGNEEVCFWYRQNVFLYIRRDTDPWSRIATHGFKEMADISFMNCVHPELYNRKTAEPPLPPTMDDESFTTALKADPESARGLMGCAIEILVHYHGVKLTKQLVRRAFRKSRAAQR
jgi:SAM-dependent methyltransferase